MEITRGDIWWASLPDPVGSGPGYRRPVLVVQNDAFNRSRLGTVVVVALSSNIRLVDAPGNVLIPARSSGLPRDSIANVTQVVTVDREMLSEHVRTVPPALQRQIDEGLRLALAL